MNLVNFSTTQLGKSVDLIRILINTHLAHSPILSLITEHRRDLQHLGEGEIFNIGRMIGTKEIEIKETTIRKTTTMADNRATRVLNQFFGQDCRKVVTICCILAESSWGLLGYFNYKRRLYAGMVFSSYFESYPDFIKKLSSRGFEPIQR